MHQAIGNRFGVGAGSVGVCHLDVAGGLAAASFAYTGVANCCHVVHCPNVTTSRTTCTWVWEAVPKLTHSAAERTGA